MPQGILQGVQLNISFNRLGISIEVAKGYKL